MVKMVSREQAEEIVKYRMPFGNFMYIGDSIMAIANETGDAEIKTFSNTQAAIKWLEL